MTESAFANNTLCRCGACLAAGSRVGARDDVGVLSTSCSGFRGGIHSFSTVSPRFFPSSSPRFSPRSHVFSPVIPRPAAGSSTHNAPWRSAFRRVAPVPHAQPAVASNALPAWLLDPASWRGMTWMCLAPHVVGAVAASIVPPPFLPALPRFLPALPRSFPCHPAPRRGIQHPQRPNVATSKYAAIRRQECVSR